MIVRPESSAHPLGPSWKGGTWNLAVFSRTARSLELCFFDPADPGKEQFVAPITRREGDVWHIALDGVQPGMLYGLRARGPWKPEEGLTFHPNRLLLDPYARAVHGDVAWRPALSAAPPPGDPNDRDNAAEAFKAVVTPPETAPFGPQYARLRTPWEETVIYETHVRDLTKLHPAVPEAQRGTYAGLAHPEVIGWLKSLGVTAVQLLPVHMHMDDEFLVQRGLTNYWGYNSLGFFAPHPEYGAAQDGTALIEEFRQMARALHEAGLELILDVVYNHTAEAGGGGPILSFRGLDHPAYYRTLPGHGFIYHDTTGCGNTVNVRNPAVLQLVMDSLRYWVQEMGADGFRFDLATAIGRMDSDFRVNAPFFQAVRQDPVLSGVKMIAEPWDVGWGGYQMGAFPPQWAELNGQFRDNIRGFWKGDPQTVPELANRITGSRELFSHNQRGPWASVNMITSHDGFTLRDLVSYNDKHNEANGEENRDGDSHNVSWNSGAEGEPASEEIATLRRRRARNLMATVFCSLGVPFVRGGDELYLTKGGNNNSYCQDSEMNWTDWSARERDEGRDMASFATLMAEIRRECPALRRRDYLEIPATAWTRPDALWLTSDARVMTSGCWRNKTRRHIGVVISREEPERSAILLLFNSNDFTVEFVLPEWEEFAWELRCDTRWEAGRPPQPAHFQPGHVYPMESWSMAVFRPRGTASSSPGSLCTATILQPVIPLACEKPKF